MKRVRKRAPLGQSTSAQISTVLSPPFFLSSVRWDQKAQMCHILRTYAGSSLTNNQRIPKGPVTPAMLCGSLKKYLKNKRKCSAWVSERRQSIVISSSHCYYHGWYNVNSCGLIHINQSLSHISPIAARSIRFPGPFSWLWSRLGLILYSIWVSSLGSLRHAEYWAVHI